MKWFDAGTKKMSVSTFGTFIKLMKVQCTETRVSPRDRRAGHHDDNTMVPTAQAGHGGLPYGSRRWAPHVGITHTRSRHDVLLWDLCLRRHAAMGLTAVHRPGKSCAAVPGRIAPPSLPGPAGER